MGNSIVLVGITDDQGKVLIQGDEQRAGYLHWMTIATLQFGTGRNASRTGTKSSGKLDSGDLTFSKKTDGASVQLVEKAILGKAPFTARIAVVEVIGLGYWREYLRYELKGAEVTNYQVSSGEGDESSMTFVLNYASGTVQVR